MDIPVHGNFGLLVDFPFSSLSSSQQPRPPLIGCCQDRHGLTLLSLAPPPALPFSLPLYRPFICALCKDFRKCSWLSGRIVMTSLELWCQYVVVLREREREEEVRSEDWVRLLCAAGLRPALNSEQSLVNTGAGRKLGAQHDQTLAWNWILPCWFLNSQQAN